MSFMSAGMLQFVRHSRRRQRFRSLGITEIWLGQGLVNSLARPGGNTTGVSILATELDGKRQEILIEAVPGLRRMAALPMLHDNRVNAASRHCRMRRAHASVELSIHRIASGEGDSRQPSTRRRRRAPER